jgi:hypothetical protein
MSATHNYLEYKGFDHRFTKSADEPQGRGHVCQEAFRVDGAPALQTAS